MSEELLDDLVKEVYVASTNPNKVKGVRNILEPLGYMVYGKSVESGVSNQPKSDEETIQGAINRAYSLNEGHLRIGLEAGVVMTSGIMYLTNFGALLDEEDNLYVAGGTRIPLPKEIEVLINSGYELKDAMDKYYNEKGINEREGAIGFFTENQVPRHEIFEHITKLLYGQYLHYKRK